jgi:SPP1 family predicted phage head-tail adaptor
MQAGQLRKRILIQSPPTGQNAYGEPLTTWADVATVWAEITPLSARELFAAQAVQSETSHKITVRYRAEFANPKTVAGMRVVHSGRIFNITGAINIDERNRTVELSATEGLNLG